MNCKSAVELMERMMFEEVQIDTNLRDHLETCPSCNQVYRDTLKSREVLELIRRSEPVLSKPVGFTDNIMSALPPEKWKSTMVPLYFKRMLAAASIALFLLFGYEQYGVVSKVSALEKKFSQISKDFDHQPQVHLLSGYTIQKAGISFSDIEKILSTEKGANLIFKSYNKKLLKIKTLPITSN
jgi:hypothetical protein